MCSFCSFLCVALGDETPCRACVTHSVCEPHSRRMPNICVVAIRLDNTHTHTSSHHPTFLLPHISTHKCCNKRAAWVLVLLLAACAPIEAAKLRRNFLYRDSHALWRTRHTRGERVHASRTHHITFTTPCGFFICTHTMTTHTDTIPGWRCHALSLGRQRNKRRRSCFFIEAECCESAGK